jgi:HAD superfamily hydrolase (TIGR01509 family)
MTSDNWKLEIENWRFPPAVIFDLDGVIVDSEPVHERAFREVFAELGFGATHGIRFADYYGKSDVTLWRDFVAKHSPQQALDELVARKQQRFLGLLRETMPVFDAVPALVATLAQRCKLAIASGSPHGVIEAALALDGLRRHFNAVVSASDVPHGKPAPDVFLEAARRLGVPAGSCCVVEDSVAGVQAARAAGMGVIAITTSFAEVALREAGAHRVVARHAELAAILAG